MHVVFSGYGNLTHYICEDFVKAGHVLVILTRNRRYQASTVASVHHCSTTEHHV